MLGFSGLGLAVHAPRPRDKEVLFTIKGTTGAPTSLGCAETAGQANIPGRRDQGHGLISCSFLPLAKFGDWMDYQGQVCQPPVDVTGFFLLVCTCEPWDRWSWEKDERRRDTALKCLQGLNGPCFLRCWGRGSFTSSFSWWNFMTNSELLLGGNAKLKVKSDSFLCSLQASIYLHCHWKGLF